MAVFELKAVAKLEREICDIETELLDVLPKQIQKARELGDLSENAEYAAAKERQRLLGSRMAQLSERLARLKLVDLSKIPLDAVGLGSTVVVYDLDNDIEVRYELVTTEESDAAIGKISTSSPIGRALLGKREGDCTEVRTPRGSREFEVVSLETIHAR